jgi:hypothetical protein
VSAKALPGWRVLLGALLAALLAVGATPAAADEDLRRLRTAELETELAKKKDLYLYLDTVESRLAVKVRGIELSSIEIREIARLVFEPLLGEAQVPPLPAPAVWTVVEGPGDTDRETIAPTTLRPYSEEEEREEPEPTAGEPPPENEVDRTRYRVQLDIGWQLYVVDGSPSLGWVRRLLAAVRDGWQRLRGAEPAHPPLIALVVAEEDARRLFHLFRTGTPILVAPIE